MNFQKYIISRLLIFTIALTVILSLPSRGLTKEEPSGEELFNNHCAGCHLNGGNLVRRGKTLKLAALNRNGITTQESIAIIARKGIGIMSGYEEVLGPEGDQKVAKWVFDQAQKAWIQG